MTSLKDSAAAFMRSYASGILGNTLLEAKATNEADFDAQLDHLCTHFLSHFCERPISFGVASLPVQWESQEEGGSRIKALIRRYVDVGVGFQVMLEHVRVTVLTDYGTHGSCLVQPTWVVVPGQNSDVEPWTFTGAYGHRKLATGEEWWEFAYVDDEVVQITKRIPHFLPDKAEGPE